MNCSVCNRELSPRDGYQYTAVKRKYVCPQCAKPLPPIVERTEPVKVPYTFRDGYVLVESPALFFYMGVKFNFVRKLKWTLDKNGKNPQPSYDKERWVVVEDSTGLPAFGLDGIYSQNHKKHLIQGTVKYINFSIKGDPSKLKEKTEEQRVKKTICLGVFDGRIREYTIPVATSRKINWAPILA